MNVEWTTDWLQVAGAILVPWALAWYATVTIATLAPIVAEARNRVRVAGE